MLPKSIADESKKYEQIILSFDPHKNKLITGTEIVKKFIIENGLIIYGGTAIDFALRLFGDKIYADETLTVPDLDFYSKTNVKHAYILADILFDNGFIAAKAINAEHLRTMRVDIVDGHFIADISYQCDEVMDIIETLTYDGMKIVAPIFQRIDMHSALSFPFDNPPNEVIFARWAKDITRFNKLAAKYPTPNVVSADCATPKICKTNVRLKKFVLTGMLAYAIMYDIFAKIVANKGAKLPPDVIGATLIIENNDHQCVQFDGFGDTELIHLDILTVAKSAQDFKNIVVYEPLGGLIPKKITCNFGEESLILYSSENKLLAIGETKIGRVVNIQYLLKHFLCQYFVEKSNEKLANAYMLRYNSLINMITTLESLMTADEINGDVVIRDIFFPSVNIYGADNISVARQIALNRMNVDLGKSEPFVVPTNYYPAKSREKSLPHPVFDPNLSEFFRERGRIISNK